MFNSQLLPQRARQAPQNFSNSHSNSSHTSNSYPEPTKYNSQRVPMTRRDYETYCLYDSLLDKSSEARGIRDYDRAHEFITKAIQLQPYRFKAYYRRGLLSWKHGNMIDTYRAMNQAIFFCEFPETVPHCTYWMLLFRGCIAELDKDLKTAEQMYGEAIEYVQSVQQQQTIQPVAHKNNKESSQAGEQREQRPVTRVRSRSSSSSSSVSSSPSVMMIPPPNFINKRSNSHDSSHEATSHAILHKEEFSHHNTPTSSKQRLLHFIHRSQKSIMNHLHIPSHSNDAMIVGEHEQASNNMNEESSKCCAQPLYMTMSNKQERAVRFESGDISNGKKRLKRDWRSSLRSSFSSFTFHNSAAGDYNHHSHFHRDDDSSGSYSNSDSETEYGSPLPKREERGIRRLTGRSMSQHGSFAKRYRAKYTRRNQFNDDYEMTDSSDSSTSSSEYCSSDDEEEDTMVDVQPIVSPAVVPTDNTMLNQPTASESHCETREDKKAEFYEYPPGEGPLTGFEAHLNLGIVKMEMMDFQGAISMFLQSLQKTAKLNLVALCYNNIACCYVRQMNDTQALKFFTKAIELYPYDVLFFINRMRTHRRLERYTEALRDCRTVLSLTKHPKTMAEAYADQGDILRKVKRTGGDRALLAMLSENASYGDYQHLTNYSSTAATAMTLGGSRGDSMYAPFNSVVEDRKRKERNHELICSLYERSIACDPSYEYSYLILAAVCADHNQMDRAIDCCNRGLRNCKSDNYLGKRELLRIRAAVYSLCIAKKPILAPPSNPSSSTRDETFEFKMSTPSSNNILKLSVQELADLEKKDRVSYELLRSEVYSRIC